MALDDDQLLVRSPTSGDEQAVRNLLVKFGYPEDSLSHVLERIESADPNALVLVAERGGAVVGVGGLSFFTVLERANPQARITVLIVPEAERGRGTGSALVNAFEQRAAERGCTRIELTSSHALPDAHAFWRALGYQETGLRFAKVLTDEPLWRPPA